jgi:DNA-binding transcriptional LysR family regulator
MEDKDWTLLLTLYKYQNITKTAEVLYVSQPSLTYRINQLEKEFGIKIMHRGRRGIEFTPQGELLVNYAKNMLLELHKVKETLLSMNDKITGTLRIGTARNFARYNLPTILKSFHTVYPDVDFTVTSTRSSELVNSVYKQEVHIGFIRGDYDWPEEKYLITQENICIVSKSQIELKELPALRRIIYNTDLSLETTIDNWWKETFSKPPNVTIQVDNMETCKEMVLNGLGFAILPTIVLGEKDNLFSYQLTTKYGEPLLRRSWMIYRKESLQIPLVSSFVEFIKEKALTLI